MKPSAKRALSLLLSAGLLLVSLVVYALLIRPEYEMVRQFRGELASKTALLEDQKISITQVQNLLAQYQGVVKLGDSLSLALPAEESLSSVMSQLNAIAQLSNLSIQSVSASYLPIKPSAAGISSAKNTGTLRLDFKLFGPYAAFKKFLQSLETNVRIMDLRNLKITPEGTKANPDLFSYNLTVDTYYQTK